MAWMTFGIMSPDIELLEEREFATFLIMLALAPLFGWLVYRFLRVMERKGWLE
jgi:hypothetical protein